MNLFYSLLSTILVAPIISGFSPSNLSSGKAFHRAIQFIDDARFDTPKYAPLVTSFASDTTVFQHKITALKLRARSALTMILRCNDEEGTDDPVFRYVIDADNYSSMYDYIAKKKLPFEFKHFAEPLGRQVICIDNICAEGKKTAWFIYKNGVQTRFGVDNLSIQKGDTVTFMLETYSLSNEQVGSGASADIVVSDYQPPFAFPIIKGTVKTSLYNYILDKGLPIDFVVFPDLGNYFILAVQRQKAKDSENQYWALYKNGALSNFGVDKLEVKEGDYIFLMLRNY